MVQKYPQPKKFPKPSRLPSCCTSRVGTVKVRHQNKPQTESGQEAYPCRRGGWHIRTKRS